MIELASPYKCKHRDAGIQKVFPNGVFDLPNGRKWTPKEVEQVPRILNRPPVPELS